MRLSAIALAIALSLVSAARCAAATEGESGENGGGTPPGVEPAKDEEVFAAIRRVNTSPSYPEMRQARLEKVLEMDRERVVAALAATIPDPERGHHYLNFAVRHLPDRRLVPFIAARIRSTADGSLLLTIRTLRVKPDRVLVSPLDRGAWSAP